MYKRPGVELGIPTEDESDPVLETGAGIEGASFAKKKPHSGK